MKQTLLRWRKWLVERRIRQLKHRIATKEQWIKKVKGYIYEDSVRIKQLEKK